MGREAEIETRRLRQTETGRPRERDREAERDREVERDRNDGGRKESQSLGEAEFSGKGAWALRMRGASRNAGRSLGRLAPTCGLPCLWLRIV